MPRLIGRRAPLQGQFRAPASKPETQRALVMGALAAGRTVIRHPLLARETVVMMDACRALGAQVLTSPDRVEVTGIGAGTEPRAPARSGGEASQRYIWAAGSALVARLFVVIGSALAERIVIDGNCVLRGRPFEPIFAALRGKGLDFAFFDTDNRLPCVTLSAALPGGRFQLATSVSSQFATALLVGAPLARRPTRIELVGPHYSLSYIRQTVEMMGRLGVPVEVRPDWRELVVPGDHPYLGGEVDLSGDFTSASYLLGAAFVTRGKITVGNLDPANTQGERAIVDILERLGAKVRWQAARHLLELDCTALPGEVDESFNLGDCPNILPTVAAVAAAIPGRVRIAGARLTQNHKSRRIDAMATELAKAGVSVQTLHDEDGMVDGLEIRGRSRLAGDVAFSSHGDHRIFMSLALLALVGERPCLFGDADETADSFPEFATVLGLTARHQRDMRDERELVAG